MNDATPNPEATAEPASTRPTDATGRTIAHWTTEALRDMVEAGREMLESVSIRAELEWRDAQEVDITADAEAFALLLDHSGFEKGHYADNTPYVTHYGTGVTLNPTEESFILLYPANGGNGSMRVVFNRETTYQAVADVACAVRTVLGTARVPLIRIRRRSDGHRR